MSTSITVVLIWFATIFVAKILLAYNNTNVRCSNHFLSFLTLTLSETIIKEGSRAYLSIFKYFVIFFIFF